MPLELTNGPDGFRSRNCQIQWEESLKPIGQGQRSNQFCSGPAEEYDFRSLRRTMPSRASFLHSKPRVHWACHLTSLTDGVERDQGIQRTRLFGKIRGTLSSMFAIGGTKVPVFEHRRMSHH